MAHGAARMALTLLPLIEGYLLHFAGLAACETELLYNGLCLPREWPPVTNVTWEPREPPYLAQGVFASTPIDWHGGPHHPRVVNIDMGRQLFVDSFLIDANLTSNRGDLISYHAAEYDEAVNPVLKAETEWEVRPGTGGWATPWHGGVWWEPREQVYKLFYACGNHECLAMSTDGLRWTRPVLPAAPNQSNIVLSGPPLRADDTVWLNLDATNESQRYVLVRSEGSHYSVWYSHDGRSFAEGINSTGPCSDASSAFYNPFRQKWVYSIKDVTARLGRMRDYREADTLEAAALWSESRTGPRVQWCASDSSDPPPDCPIEGGPRNQTQLYNLNAIAFESVLVGLFTLITGKRCDPPRPFGRGGEQDSVFLGFSRDGFHWFRPPPPRKAFLPMSDIEGAWNFQNVQPAASFLTLENSLRFYISARSGSCDGMVPPLPVSAHCYQNGNATTGIASLRRDGFASVSPCAADCDNATIVTVPIVFTKPAQFLFVNVQTASTGGSLRVGLIVESTGEPLHGRALEQSVPIRGDRTRTMVHWRGTKGLSYDNIAEMRGKPFRLQFFLEGGYDTKLFSFWVSTTACGESGGYVAGGGSSFNSSRDVVGNCATMGK